jgi:hypothetical protein
VEGRPEDTLPAEAAPGRDGALAEYQKALAAMPAELPTGAVLKTGTDYSGRTIGGRRAPDTEKWPDAVKALEETLKQKKREAEREPEHKREAEREPEPKEPTDPELVGVQVPIPREIRQFNDSGWQCAWCTLAMLCRYHNVEAGKQITDQYRHTTVPGEVYRVLRSKGIHFKGVSGRDEAFLEEYVTRKKLGVGIGVNRNHVVLVCHFDKAKGEVKFIDNADPSLRIWTCDMQKFRKHFTGWAFVIFPPGHPDAARRAR